MAKIVKIHGALQGAPLLFNPAPLTTRNRGFFKWKKQLDSGKAIVFPWGINKPLTKLQQWNPRNYLTLYLQEKRLVRGQQALQRLDNFLKLHKPEIIVCHSLGTNYFLQYINKFLLLNSVKKIIFVTGGVERNFQITNTAVVKRIESNSLVWINYFCPWDNVLPFTSLFLSRKIAAGLFGTNNPYVKNEFVFLPIPLGRNSHMRIINDEGFINKIVKRED